MAERAVELPYAELDVAGTGEGHRYIAGEAFLAEMAESWADRQHDTGRMSSERCEALRKLAGDVNSAQLEQLAAPDFTLYGVVVKLAYALRLGNEALLVAGTNGQSAFSLLGGALADLVLIREAEAQRRFKLSRSEVGRCVPR